MQKKIKEYLNQDINNPKYLFHGSPIRTTIIIPMQSHDYTGNVNNIANAIFLFPSLIKASAYAFKDTIKKNSEGLKWNFEIPNSNDFPVMTMENVNIDENIIGYVYVFLKDDDMVKDNDSYQYKCYKQKKPIDVVEITYRDFKSYYQITNNKVR